jgi:hypothetical protein
MWIHRFRLALGLMAVLRTLGLFFLADILDFGCQFVRGRPSIEVADTMNFLAKSWDKAGILHKKLSSEGSV